MIWLGSHDCNRKIKWGGRKYLSRNNQSQLWKRTPQGRVSRWRRTLYIVKKIVQEEESKETHQWDVTLPNQCSELNISLCHGLNILSHNNWEFTALLLCLVHCYSSFKVPLEFCKCILCIRVWVPCFILLAWTRRKLREISKDITHNHA